jgi:aspartokinase
LDGGVIRVTVSHIVEKLMDEYSFLQIAVSKDIVSFTLLAKYLRPEIEKELQKKVKPSAIIMALRRYAEKLEKKENQFKSHFFRNIILKTDVCYMVIDSSSDTLDKLQNMYNEIDFKQGDIFNIIQGNYEISVITNKKYQEKLMELIGQEKIKKLVDDHISISLLYSKDYSFTPGVLYNVSRNIAWENINILTCYHTPTELSLILHQNDAMKCYNILEKMLKKNENNIVVSQYSTL